MKYSILLSILLLIVSCTQQEADNEFTYWVNSYTVDCVGVAPMRCMLIQKGETLVAGEWQNFYSQIEGFDFQAGYIYKIKVLEEKLENVPADASSIRYTLVKVKEKKADTKMNINDIWVATSINGEIIKMNEGGGNAKNPQIEIHIAEMQIMGTDGCNNFNGGITTFDDGIIECGPIAGTRMMCPDMTIPDKFNVALSQVKKYEIEKLQLTFSDEQGKELIVFKKID